VLDGKDDFPCKWQVVESGAGGGLVDKEGDITHHRSQTNPQSYVISFLRPSSHSAEINFFPDLKITGYVIS
jgi:hypothetical protein